MSLLINDLKPKDVGRWVRFTYSHGETQEGRIKSWNDRFVFVVFKCAGEWARYQDFTGEACEAENIEFMQENK